LGRLDRHVFEQAPNPVVESLIRSDARCFLNLGCQILVGNDRVIPASRRQQGIASDDRPGAIASAWLTFAPFASTGNVTPLE